MGLFDFIGEQIIKREIVHEAKQGLQNFIDSKQEYAEKYQASYNYAKQIVDPFTGGNVGESIKATNVHNENAALLERVNDRYDTNAAQRVGHRAAGAVASALGSVGGALGPLLTQGAEGAALHGGQDLYAGERADRQEKAEIALAKREQARPTALPSLPSVPKITVAAVGPMIALPAPAPLPAKRVESAAPAPLPAPRPPPVTVPPVVPALPPAVPAALPSPQVNPNMPLPSLGSIKDQAADLLRDHSTELKVGATALGAAGLAGGAIAVASRKRKKKAKKSTSHKSTSHKATSHKKKRTSTRAKAKHKPRARGGTHNGHRVYIAKNGTRYIKLKSGKVRFIK